MPLQEPRSRATRAVTANQKLERRREILSAAGAHFRSVGFEDFSMEILAKKLGIARGTLYRYFATREELLLGVYEEQRELWSKDLVTAVHPGMSDPAFVDCFLDRTRDNPLFLALSARLESVIEHNVSIDRLIESKSSMRELMLRLGAHLSECLDLTVRDAQDVIISFGTLLLGAAQIDAGPSLEKVELPVEIREMMDSFSCDDIFRTNAQLILDGIRRRRERTG